MGIDPAPFMANLFLHYYENKFIKSLIENGDLDKATKLKDTFRYLDDLLSINDDLYFKDIICSMYPNELKLSATNSDLFSTEFLDLDISISEGKLLTKVFDKRRNFSFKAINYPDLKFSNVPYNPSYGIYFSQLIRILRICNKLEYFMDELKLLTHSFLAKGFCKMELKNIFMRFISKYKQEWGKFGEEVPLPEYLC